LRPGLHDTTDALNFLSQVAENASHNAVDFRGRVDSGLSQKTHIPQGIGNLQLEGQYLSDELVPYHLITAGLLTVAQGAKLFNATTFISWHLGYHGPRLQRFLCKSARHLN
jgi:hypothetical protein